MMSRWIVERGVVEREFVRDEMMGVKGDEVGEGERGWWVRDWGWGRGRRVVRS